MYEDPQCVDVEIDGYEFYQHEIKAQVINEIEHQRTIGRSYSVVRRPRVDSWSDIGGLIQMLREHIRELPDEFYWELDEQTLRALACGGAVNASKIKLAAENQPEIIAWYRETRKAGV